MRTVIASLITFLTLLLVTERALSWYGYHHFLPVHVLNDALLLPSATVVYSGDSRVVAGFHRETLEQALQSSGMKGSVVNLSLGGVDASGQYILIREYLRQRSMPRIIVLGYVFDSLVSYDSGYWPENFRGSAAVKLVYSNLADVRLLYPEFPQAMLKPALSFLIARTNSFQIYASLVWRRVQQLQDRLVGSKAKVLNQFGDVGEMRSYADFFLGFSLVTASDESKSTWKLHPVVHELLKACRLPDCQVVFARVPMPEAYEKGLLAAPYTAEFNAWFAKSIIDAGGAVINLHNLSGITESDFEDGLHLGSNGALVLSKELASKIADKVSAWPDQDPGTSLKH